MHIAPRSGIRNNARTDNAMLRRLITMVTCAVLGLGAFGFLSATASVTAAPSEKTTTVEAASVRCHTVYILGRHTLKCSYL